MIIMGKSKGQRSKSRKKLRKNVRDRGKLPTRKIIQEFPIGSKVTIILDPSVARGRPHPKFHGKTGVTTERRGKAYEVEVKDGNSIKKVISRPEHLRLVEA